MAKILKTNNHPQEEKIEDYIFHPSKELKADTNKRPLAKILPQYRILKQRDNQRKILFRFCIWTIGILLTLMFIILFLQIFYKWETGNDLINPAVYNTVFVSVIIQFIGVVYIIAKKLWDEKEVFALYPLLGEYHKK